MPHLWYQAACMGNIRIYLLYFDDMRVILIPSIESSIYMCKMDNSFKSKL